MPGTTLMGGPDKFPIDSPAIAHPKAVVIGAQQGGSLLKAAARQDITHRDHVIGHHPQPLQLGVDLPAGLVHGIDGMLLGGVAKRMPSGLPAARRSIHGPADRTAILGMGHAEAFIHLHRQGQGLRGLPGIAPLHSLLALAATADRNVETTPESCAVDFLLILRLNAFHFQFAATVTLRGYRDGDDFIHFLGNGLATVLTVGRAGFASRGLGISLARTAGKGGGLSFGGSLRFLQLLLQFLVFLAQSFSLPFQTLLLPFKTLPLPFPSFPLLFLLAPQPLVLS